MNSLSKLIPIQNPARKDWVRAYLPFLTGLLTAPVLLWAQEPPLEGRVSWQERGLLVLVNSARLDPPAYGRLYLGSQQSILASYSPKVPYDLDTALWQAARAHSQDMGGCNKMSHNSCDGTSMANRLRSYLKNSRAIAENVASGQKDPNEVMRSWINSSGHRENILSAKYTRIGCGYALASGKHWWTQTFADGSLREENQISGGAHFLLRKDTLTFLLTFSSTSAPGGIRLVFEGNPEDMRLIAGNSKAGVYRAAAASAGACRQYHFEVVTADNRKLRYPARGTFHTYGDGKCQENWSAASNTASLRDAKNLRNMHEEQESGFGSNSTSSPTGPGYAADGRMRSLHFIGSELGNPQWKR